jgi:type III restriction enzyme
LLGPLDNAAEGLMAARLGNVLPVEPRTLDRFFVVQPVSGDKGSRFEFLLDKSKMLRKLLVHRAPLMPTGLLIFCLEYARGGQQQRGGILDAVGGRFRELSNGAMLGLLQQVYEFRNTYIAHQKQELTVPSDAEAALVTWIRALVEMHEAAAVSAASGP